MGKVPHIDAVVDDVYRRMRAHCDANPEWRGNVYDFPG